MMKTKNNLLSEQLRYNGRSDTPTHLHLCNYTAENVTIKKAERLSELLVNLKEEGIHWLQVHGLRDTKVVEEVCKYFSIDFLTTQDILNAKHLTKIEEKDNYNIVLVKQLIAVDEEEYEPQQLCIIQGEDFILTFSEKETDFFEEIYNAIENNVLKVRHRQTDFLLSVILNSVMTNYMSIISNMEDQLEEMEECLLTPNPDDDPGIEDIQQFRRNYRVIKNSVMPLKEQIGKLFHTENTLLHEANRPFFNDVNDHLQFVLQTLDGCRDMISSLVDMYLSNNDQRMNGIMKQLTIVSTIFIPLTFFAGIWGMNFELMPELHWRYGYLFAWLLMIGMAIGVYIYFKRKKWY